MEEIKKSNKVLNIQSHVVHGYVGNKATTFPLQMLNWDVDVLNTVNFSNHTGYGSWEGTCSSANELNEIYKGLKHVGLQYDALLTGYVFGSESLKAVGDICIDIKKRQNALDNDPLWLLDPVMGDEGVLYVSEDVIPVYQSILATGLVDIVTPNQFELELLMETKITSVASLKEALKGFHEKYRVKHIVLSSLFPETIKELSNDHENILCCVSSPGEDLAYFKVHTVEGHFTGVGDLFSCLLLDRFYRRNNILEATNEVLSVMKKVLQVTSRLSGSKGKINDPSMKECELRLIECKNIFEQSEKDFTPIFS